MFKLKKKLLSDISEVYKNIITSIEQSPMDNKLKTLLISSSEVGEGKSTICSNLACLLANEGKKVLLIDADLIKFSIHKIFKIKNDMGLSDYLSNEFDLKSIIGNINSNIHVITSGYNSSNTYEMLSSIKMDNLLEEVRKNYDYILIDSTPIKKAKDALALVSKCDGTIYVVKADSTKKNSAIEWYNLLKEANANFIGSIFNGVKYY